MDRTQWRKERRLWNEVQMDAMFARKYDQDWGSIAPSHRRMLERFLDLCPKGGAILDAACGTGKYWPILLERGFSVHGTDQSQQMLHQAQGKFPAVPVKHLGMQELSFVDAFDGIMCMDAMEMAFPEDWPLILHNFARALHEHGFLYLTVEMTTQEELDIAYEAGQRLGLPLIYGEYAHHGGYHYYPNDEQVRTWLAETQFTLLDVTEGDEYRHYLTSKVNG
jgi:2-polyprenyl-3-methyl-5-hydroxy-6-metoxy-1,4-benzoquinol methylase